MEGNSLLPTDFPSKLAAWDPVSGWIPVKYENQYQKQVISGVNRVLIASDENGIELLRTFSRFFAGPYRLAYLLVTPPDGYELAKYQVDGLELEAVDQFLTEFEEFLSSDARHHLWIHARTSGGTLIYDEHGWIYCYGAQESVLEWLLANGYKDEMPQIPFPHLHNENSKFNLEMERVFKALPWVRVPVSNLG